MFRVSSGLVALLVLVAAGAVVVARDGGTEEPGEGAGDCLPIAVLSRPSARSVGMDRVEVIDPCTSRTIITSDPANISTITSCGGTVVAAALRDTADGLFELTPQGDWVRLDIDGQASAPACNAAGDLAFVRPGRESTMVVVRMADGTSRTVAEVDGLAVFPVWVDERTVDVVRQWDGGQSSAIVRIDTVDGATEVRHRRDGLLLWHTWMHEGSRVVSTGGTDGIATTHELWPADRPEDTVLLPAGWLPVDVDDRGRILVQRGRTLGLWADGQTDVRMLTTVSGGSDAAQALFAVWAD